LKPARPWLLFAAHIVPTTGNNAMNYDVTADGKCFLIDTAAGPRRGLLAAVERRGELECGAEKVAAAKNHPRQTDRK